MNKNMRDNMNEKLKKILSFEWFLHKWTGVVLWALMGAGFITVVVLSTVPAPRPESAPPQAEETAQQPAGESSMPAYSATEQAPEPAGQADPAGETASEKLLEEIMEQPAP